VATTRHLFHLKIVGMPYAVPIVIAVLALYSFILFKTKAGRYLYAIGGNVEAAVAPACGESISFARLRHDGFTAGIAGSSTPRHSAESPTAFRVASWFSMVSRRRSSVERVSTVDEEDDSRIDRWTCDWSDLQWIGAHSDERFR